MRVLLLAGVLLLGACHSRVYLMPTPEVLRDPDFNLFEINPEPITTNAIRTLYATTRTPARSASAIYSGRKGSRLRIGYADVMVGEGNVVLSELISQSTAGDRTERFAVSVLDAPVFDSVPLTEPRPGSDRWPEVRKSIERINELISRKPIKELTIFVHGSINSFYVSIARGAQFQYFTGDNALVLTFAWPSLGYILGYGTDKRMANAAAADLALFIELLAEYSVAERINLLAYSAGGRTAAGALALLGERHQDPSALKLGQVYLAQSDQPLVDFFNDLPSYFDLLEGMTVTAAPGDPVLRLASITDNKTRLGSVREGQKLDLSPEVSERLAEILRSEQMVIIDLREVPAEGYRFTHGAWYDSPWVSTDVMMALLGGLTAEERGLESLEVPGAIVWRFPPDYVERLRADIQVWRREQDRQAGQRPRAAGDAR